MGKHRYLHSQGPVIFVSFPVKRTMLRVGSIRIPNTIFFFVAQDTKLVSPETLEHEVFICTLRGFISHFTEG